VSDFLPGAGGLFSIAVAYGLIDERTWPQQGIDYWALGGIHRRGTSASGAYLAHYPGTPQGRQPDEAGLHGATLVQVDVDGHARLRPMPCDAVRFCHSRIAIDATTSRQDLERRLAEHVARLRADAPGLDLLCGWTIEGPGPLADQLRRGHLASELIAWLRSEYGHGTPALWSVSLVAQASEPPIELYEQDTILSDLLREVRRLDSTPDEPLPVDAYLDRGHVADAIAEAVRILDPPTRSRTLREVAALSVDLLGAGQWGGEEPLP
jgi:DNA repair exonuclease SbcCD nuclease subunit